MERENLAGDGKGKGASGCEGRVGAVLAIEASRLARNGRDWHTLIEFCGLVDTIIVDEDGI